MIRIQLALALYRLARQLRKGNNMEGTKKWYQSEAIWGSIITIAALAATFFGITIDADMQALLLENILAVISGLVAIIGAIMSLHGRYVAKTQIK